MSSPYDPAEGYRPPPPRSGEPPTGGYPPPTGHWQAQPPPHPHRRKAKENTKGVLTHLFDFSFEHMVTPHLIRAAYVFAVASTTLLSLFWLVVGFVLFQFGYLLTVFFVLVTPSLWLGSLLVTRMFLEFMMVHFKMNEHIEAIRERS